MSNKYQVATGIVIFRDIEADSPRAALQVLKTMIDQRRHSRYNPDIGMSLVEALDQGRLNFLVFDAARRHLLAGEHNGVYQEPVTRELGRAMRSHLSLTELAGL